MTLIIAFVISFVAGPLAFWVLSKQPPSRGYVIGLWVVFAFLVLFSFAAHRIYLPQNPGSAVGVASVVMPIWLAWIVLLAVFVLTVRDRALETGTKRLAIGIGAVATTLPWFGLCAAQLMAN